MFLRLKVLEKRGVASLVPHHSKAPRYKTSVWLETHYLKPKNLKNTKKVTPPKQLYRYKGLDFPVVILHSGRIDPR